jgi:hypothetical protein
VRARIERAARTARPWTIARWAQKAANSNMASPNVAFTR